MKGFNKLVALSLAGVCSLSSILTVNAATTAIYDEAGQSIMLLGVDEIVNDTDRFTVKVVKEGAEDDYLYINQGNLNDNFWSDMGLKSALVSGNSYKVVIGGETADDPTEIAIDMDYVAATEISLNKQVTVLDIGGKVGFTEEQLVVTTVPAVVNSTLEWTSSDEDVVTVDNGKLTPVANGTAVVTVRATDTGVSAKVTVRVKDTTGSDITTDNDKIYNVVSGMEGSDLNAGDVIIMGNDFTAAIDKPVSVLFSNPVNSAEKNVTLNLLDEGFEGTGTALIRVGVRLTAETAASLQPLAAFTVTYSQE